MHLKNIKIGEFLCSHFNIEDEKICNIFGISCFTISRKVKTQLNARKDLCSVWRRCCDWLSCQNWFAKFCAGDFSLDNAAWEGKSVEVEYHSNRDINGEQSMWCHVEIANILKISKSIKLLVKMKKCVFYFMEKTKQNFWPTQYNA